jgi:hypothetical protein
MPIVEIQPDAQLALRNMMLSITSPVLLVCTKPLGGA